MLIRQTKHSVNKMAANLQFPSKYHLDDWSVREKLVLACCVIRSGDQNWASVSRTIKPICEAVESRTPDWFSQKNCANQYSDLLEGTSTKKRKRTSSESGANETPMEQIIRKLSFERIDELKKLIQGDRKKYKKLKNDIEKIRSGKVDDQLQHIWNELRGEKRLSIEHIIPEDMTELPMTLGLDPLVPGFPTSSPHSQQHQQQSSALYHRSKSQRQPKTTKKFETWMTQLKQQQARHQQSHSGSTHTSPHGSATSTAVAPTDGLSLPGGEMSPNLSMRHHHQAAQQSPYHHMQQQQQQQHFFMQQQQQQNQYQQQQQFLKNQQQMAQNPMIPRTSPMRQMSAMDIQPGSQAAVGESGSVLSTLLSAPPSEIKAAAAFQQKIIGKTSGAVDASGLALSNREDGLSVEDDPNSAASISATAPTLSKLLGSSDGSQAEMYTGRRMSLSSDEGDLVKEKKIEKSRFSFKDDIENSSLKASSPIKAMGASLEDNTSKKGKMSGSHQSSIEPLHIKVEDEDYMPDNESGATPDSSQTSPHGRNRKLKARKVMKKKQLQHLLLKNLEALQDSEDTGSIDEQTSEREEMESDIASVSDTKDTSDGEQDDSQLVDELEDQKMAEDSPEARDRNVRRKQRVRLPSSTSSSTNVLSPMSPTLSTGSNDPDNAQAQRNWRKSVMLVWKSIASHKYANVFMHPVTDEEAPGYHNIIKRPIDLSTIKKNIETGVLKTTSEFQRDTMLMFQNALMYNRADHDVYRMAEEMREEVMEQIQSFIATQFHLMVQSSDRDTMMLRGHRCEGDWADTRKTKTHGRASGKI